MEACAKSAHSKRKWRTVNGASQPTHCGCSSPSSKYECVTLVCQGTYKDTTWYADVQQNFITTWHCSVWVLELISFLFIFLPILLNLYIGSIFYRHHACQTQYRVSQEKWNPFSIPYYSKAIQPVKSFIFQLCIGLYPFWVCGHLEGK